MQTSSIQCLNLKWRICKAAAISACAVLLLASCGRPDASGIYVAASDRRVELVQIVETKDGILTGRLEEMSVNANGVVKDRTTPLDGAASGKELMFKPTSAWFGGLQATGSLTIGGLTLTGNGNTLNVARSNMGNYQAAVAHLQSIAANDRQRIATANMLQARKAAEARTLQNTINTASAIQSATARIRADTTRMNEGIDNCPDFGQRAAANTARIAKGLRIAPTLSEVQRNQLVVEANQIEIGTNQIEIARSQYAGELNLIVQDAESIADQAQRVCDSPQGVQFAQPCSPAKAAVADFKLSLARGRQSFLGYKQAVQNELTRQSTMIEKMGEVGH